ncbi:MAG: phosphoenolpyruvate--protein phosphotransferase [Zetaproteobacteria bacterium]|nr:MAG: phosphoenolpyruvate--protein phosphotransferase [Zetaproteobacteria bacterium]
MLLRGPRGGVWRRGGGRVSDPAPRRREGRAVAASSGVVIGRVRRIGPLQRRAPRYRVDPAAVDRELARFEAARRAAVSQVEQELQALEQVADGNPALLLRAHLLLLEDRAFIEAVTRQIVGERRNAHWGIHCAIERMVPVFDTGRGEPSLQEVRTQLDHAGGRIIAHLTGEGDGGEQPQEQEGAATVLVAEELPLPDVVTWWRRGVAGIISLSGGANSHVIVMTRGIGLPALVGIDRDAFGEACDGDGVILDGERGCWILHPDAHDLIHYRRFRSAMGRAVARLATYAGQETVTCDGRRVRLMCNVEFPQEMEAALRVGCDGIGLLRTEFAFLTARTAPDEEEQYAFYRRFLDAIGEKPVTIRLLDLGADKLPAFRREDGYRRHGENPALGLRGIRLLLRAPQLLRPQLRAIIRCAAAGRRVRLLVPMVTHVAQMEALRAALVEEMAALGLHPELPVGAMIEVPAAVLIARELAVVSDFFSIGSNDLIQYTLAVDRSDEEVFADGLPIADHPAVRRLIAMAAEAAVGAGIPISICGELAAVPEWSATLLRMGIDELSMSAGRILALRRHICQLDLGGSAADDGARREGGRR